MLDIKLDFTWLDAELDKVRATATQRAREGAAAGARVYYNAVLRVAPVSEKGHWFHGTSFKKNGTKYWFESGSLRGAVYQWFVKDGDPRNPVYQIAWNHRKVPYGFMVVYGTTRTRVGNDFIGDAQESVEQLARAAMLLAFNRN